jgi:DNA-binding NarL/FixJ family response regulator
MSRPRILLADDHAFLLDAFEDLLAPEFDVVGRVSDGRALVAAAEALRPDLIVLDIHMPLLNGFDAAHQIKQTLPQIKLVFLTMDDDFDVAARAAQFGASAYLHKLWAGSELAATVRKLADGG